MTIPEILLEFLQVIHPKLKILFGHFQSADRNKNNYITMDQWFPNI